MIKFRELLETTGRGTNVKIGYKNSKGFFYNGELQDAPKIDGDSEIYNLYVFTGEDALTIILN